jgi:threonine aldolase
MKRAMVTAALGDDGAREDPTVNELEAVAAARVGKEAALLVPSGTMGNLIGLLLSARRGEEVIADAISHVVMSEAGGAAVVGGVHIREVSTQTGVITPADIDEHVHPPSDVHQPRSAAVTIENTHNLHGGTAWTVLELDALAEAARRHGLRIHMDGARLFNAAVAVGVAAAELAARADTVTFCLSKGLSCPAGSMLCGTHDAIDEARRWRAMLGGGMRQSGVLAAAGLVALDTMVDRMAEDHENARVLAEGIATVPGIDCDPGRVRTNIVLARFTGISSAAFVAGCARIGLLGRPVTADQVRFVTHAGVSEGDIHRAVRVCRDVLSADS